MRLPGLAAAAGAALLAVAGCSSASPAAGGEPARPATPSPATPAPTATATPASGVPQPAHTLVVILENHGFGQVIGSSEAPFLTDLARRGALFTHSYAITHPSEPNYLALFSGSTQGVTSDACPVSFTAPNLASGLLAVGKTFTGYAEGLPAAGSQVCGAGDYARKHVPWADFRNLPLSVSQPFSAFPADFDKLPTVSFVIPNLCDDMHDCSVATGDAWLRAHLRGYVTWAMTHDSLLIVTFDEDDDTQVNQIPTIFVGQQVQPGSYPEQITHYRVLATIEAAYGLPRDRNAATASPITDIWRH